MSACLFFVEDAPRDLDRRVAAVERWFGRPAVLDGRSGAVFLGDTEEPTTWWLEPPPPPLDHPWALLTAEHQHLRALRTGLAVAHGDARTRLVTGPCGPTALYHAQGDTTAFSTHAVVAALLAGVEPRVDPAVLPAMLVLGGPLGDRGLLAGVAPVPPATMIDIDAAGIRTAEYWPRADRWAPVPAAHTFTADALLRSLDDRLRYAPDAWLGLTAGLDSRVVAAAIAELGLPVRTFTWGHAEADTAGAAHVAAALELHHERAPVHWHDEAAGRRHIEHEVRFNEGLGRMNGFGDLAWPGPLRKLVTGAGGETGRAFWWRAVGRNRSAPTPAQAAAVITDPLVLRAAPAARRALRATVGELLDGLHADGVAGWTLLDALYAEQRVAHWGRGMLHRHPPATLAAFVDPDVQRGLASASVEDRMTDGFHRAFLTARGFAAGEAPPTQRTGVPPAARRAAALVRARRANAGAWPWTAQLRERPAYAAWLRDGVLGHPLVLEALGAKWSHAMQRAFDSDQNFTAAEAAVTLTGPVALHAALAG